MENWWFQGLIKLRNLLINKLLYCCYKEQGGKMKSLLEQVTEIDSLIHALKKMESNMQTGRWLDVHRSCCRLLAALQKAKEDIIYSNQKNNNEE